MINDMQYTLASEEVNNTEGVNMPLYNQDNGVSLIDLMYEDYNSEKWNQLLDQMSYEEQCKLVLMRLRVQLLLTLLELNLWMGQLV